MRKLLSILLTTAILLGSEGSNYFVDNFLKYSTFYTSVSLASPFTPAETFAVDIRPQMITPYLEVYANKDSFTIHTCTEV